MTLVPTYLEQVESYLVDEFHHGLHRIIVETLWSEIRVGAWANDLDFFKCLEREYEFLLSNRMKLLQVEIRVRDMNFSGQPFVNGEVSKFLGSRMPCNRQKILLLHSLRLMIEKRNESDSHQNSLVRILRREIHQCLRMVFFYFQGYPDRNQLHQFIDVLDRFEFLEMTQVLLDLANYMGSWLARQGMDRTEVDDLNKLHTFFLALSRWRSYHPQQSPEPVDFQYGHIFSDPQKLGFFSSLHYETDRLLSLIYLQGLSHLRPHALDGLTRVADRKTFDEEIQRWLVRRSADQRSFMCCMIDLDHFKIVNDTHGHQAGDFVLQQTADFLKKNLGDGDFLARYGGEEFVLLLENTGIQEAQEKLNALLSVLRIQTFEYKGNAISVTLSCGLAEYVSGDTKESLVARADTNLYEAKRSGRDRVISTPVSC